MKHFFIGYVIAVAIIVAIAAWLGFEIDPHEFDRLP
jgi:acyl carrier protein